MIVEEDDEDDLDADLGPSSPTPVYLEDIYGKEAVEQGREEDILPGYDGQEAAYAMSWQVVANRTCSTIFINFFIDHILKLAQDVTRYEVQHKAVNPGYYEVTLARAARLATKSGQNTPNVGLLDEIRVPPRFRACVSAAVVKNLKNRLLERYAAASSGPAAPTIGKRPSVDVLVEEARKRFFPHMQDVERQLAASSLERAREIGLEMATLAFPTDDLMRSSIETAIQRANLSASSRSGSSTTAATFRGDRSSSSDAAQGHSGVTRNIVERLLMQRLQDLWNEVSHPRALFRVILPMIIRDSNLGLEHAHAKKRVLGSKQIAKTQISDHAELDGASLRMRAVQIISEGELRSSPSSQKRREYDIRMMIESLAAQELSRRFLNTPPEQRAGSEWQALEVAREEISNQYKSGASTVAVEDEEERARRSLLGQLGAAPTSTTRPPPATGQHDPRALHEELVSQLPPTTFTQPETVPPYVPDDIVVFQETRQLYFNAINSTFTVQNVEIALDSIQILTVTQFVIGDDTYFAVPTVHPLTGALCRHCDPDKPNLLPGQFIGTGTGR